jgi:hypothetical protein
MRRYRLILLVVCLLGLGVSLALAQIRFDRGLSSVPSLGVSGSVNPLINMTDGSSNSWLFLDTSNDLARLKVGNHTFTYVTEAGGTMEEGILAVTPTWSPTSNTTKTLTGVGGTVTTAGANTFSRAIGGAFQVTHGGSNTITNVMGIRAVASLGASSGNVTNAKALWGIIQNTGSNTITEANALEVYVNKFNSGPITNAKGVYIASGFNGVTGTKHSLYAEDTSALNYFGGLVGIGITTPTQPLHVSTNSDSLNTLIQMELHSTSNASPALLSRKSRGTQASPTIVATDDPVMTLQGVAYHGSAYIAIGDIQVMVDGTVTSGQRPGSRIVFRTTIPNGSVTERWRISNPGHWLAGADNSYDIGAAGATRPRTGYFGTSVISPILATGSDSGTITLGASHDVVLAWDAANQLALRNSTSGQTFRVYGTFTNASNYERLEMAWDGSNNWFRIAATAAGSGTNRSIAFVTGGSSRWRLDSSGNWIAIADNSYDIGSASARPRDLFLGRNLVQAAGGYYELTEIAEPGAPGANGARLYSKDNGSGKSQLCARFASGASQCFATEP